MMLLKVEKAILNNIAWCGVVCDTHGINCFWRGNLWGMLTEAPSFYPGVISANMEATMAELGYFIDNGRVSSIKDSYANLDLSPFGFKKLFDAEWIWHPPVSSNKSPQTKWRVITNERDLVQWTSKSGLTDVIKPNLLEYENVKNFSLENNEGVSGFITNVDEGVVGVSNVFSEGRENESLWREIPRVVSNEYPGMSMVGYEHGSDLDLAKKSGWESLGPLRVWIKSE